MTTSKFAALFTRIALVTPLALTSACASLHPPARSSGPAVSREGVQVAVQKEQCTHSRDPEGVGEGLTEETVEIEVRNTPAGQVTLHPDQFRLRTPDGAALKPATWGAAAPLVINAGATRTFELRFMSQGVDCSSELVLDAGAGVVIGLRPVKVGAVRFAPAGAPAAQADLAPNW